MGKPRLKLIHDRGKTMYFIRKEGRGFHETVYETQDPCKAYELAHQLDAQVKGIEPSEHTQEGCMVTIKDQDGKDAWNRCAQLRCPSNTGGMLS